MKAELDEIRSRIDIVDLVNEDCPLERHGDEYIGWDQKHPSESKTSLAVSRNKQLFHCFNCGAGGDVFSWLMHFKGMSFPDAVSELAQRTGVVLAGVDEVERQRQEQVYTDRKALAPLLMEAANFYHSLLKDEHIAHALVKWGLTKDTLIRLKVGYAPPGGSILYHHLSKQGYDKALLTKSGLFYQNKGFLNDVFRGRLMFPYWNNNQVVYFIGRWVEGCPEERDKPKYRKQMVNSQDRPYISPAISNGWFYGEDTAYGAQNLIISEGVGDCIAALQAGFNCISPVTVRFRKEDYPKILKLSKKADRVFICNDQEDNQSGTKGALATAAYLEDNGIRVGIIALPQPEGQGKIDLAEYLRDNPPEGLRQLITEAKTIWEVKAGYLERTGNRVEDLRRVSDFVKTELASCDELIRQAVVTGVLKDRFWLSKDEVGLILGHNNITQSVGVLSSEREYPHTDVGNAERFADRYREKILYNYNRKKWMEYTGITWAEVPDIRIVALAKSTVRYMQRVAVEIEENSKRQELLKWAVKCESEHHIAAMTNLARSEPDMSISEAQFDLDPMLLNVMNGTVNLKTCELQPHDPKDYITKLAPVVYDPAATCPTFEKFLHRIMEGKASSIEYLQRLFGYCLTGSTIEQKVFFPFGCGANGKSTLLETIRRQLGDYSKSAPANTFLIKSFDSIPNDLAGLKGARFVTGMEVEAGRKLSESLVKQVTGGDAIKARFLHKEYFEYHSTFKVFIATNHRVEVQRCDHSIWRRIVELPFNVTIPEEEQDKQLLDKLADEMPGILNWCLEGCLVWQREGLGEPEEIKAATAEYRREMDKLSDFIEDVVEKVPFEEARVKNSDMFAAYQKWCSENGEAPLASRKLNKGLIERGLRKPEQGTGNYYYWRGIKLNEIYAPSKSMYNRGA